MSPTDVIESKPQGDPLNAICPYWTMFPLDFPLGVLSGASAGDWVLDPFCGRGTTLYAARKLGLPAVGIDSNAVATAIAAAKLVSVEPNDILALARELAHQTAAATAPEGEFWTSCFAPRVLQGVCRLRAGLAGRDDEVAVALRAIVLGALHGPRNKGAPSYLSNQMPRTYATKPRAALAYWRRNGCEPPDVDVVDVIERHAERRYGTAPASTAGGVWTGDAAAVLPRLRRKFSWVITSPPYPGMVTYRPDGWLRGWFVGGPPEPDYDRSGQLGAATGARFVAGLADVWSAVARRCTADARLIVRFGALPSIHNHEPEDLLLASLNSSGAWSVESIDNAGVPARTGARQAEQVADTGDHVPEIDVVAVKRD